MFDTEFVSTDFDFETDFCSSESLFCTQFDESKSYILQPATTEKLGGVIIGENLLVTPSGVLSVDVIDRAEQGSNRPITANVVAEYVGSYELVDNEDIDRLFD